MGWFLADFYVWRLFGLEEDKWVCSFKFVTTTVGNDVLLSMEAWNVGKKLYASVTVLPVLAWAPS